MSSKDSRSILSGALILLTGCGSDGGSIITGQGFPNPNPVVTTEWGALPAGRSWGHTAGVDIDPTDAHIWAYERCGAGGGSGAAGGGANCDSNPVDPIFKFDRDTGEVLANFGAGIFTTPHGIHADFEGNVWVTDFVANASGTKGQQVHKFSPDGELLISVWPGRLVTTAPTSMGRTTLSLPRRLQQIQLRLIATGGLLASTAGGAGACGIEAGGMTRSRDDDIFSFERDHA